MPVALKKPFQGPSTTGILLQVIDARDLMTTHRCEGEDRILLDVAQSMTSTISLLHRSRRLR